jgi:hypothetical protein
MKRKHKAAKGRMKKRNSDTRIKNIQLKQSLTQANKKIDELEAENKKLKLSVEAPMCAVWSYLLKLEKEGLTPEIKGILPQIIETCKEWWGPEWKQALKDKTHD